MNPLKYKKRQQTSILQPVEVFTSSKFSKLNFIQPNPHKKPHQPIKLQRSYRQPRILIKKERYESIELSSERKSQIRSLSLRRSNHQTEKSLEKSILFKRPVRNKQKTINSSIQVSKPELNPHLDRLKRTSQNKKLSILDEQPSYKQIIDSSEVSKKQLTLINRYNEYESKKSESKSKFRVKSTFTKLDSIDLVNSISQESSSMTLVHKQRSSKSNSKAGFEKHLQKIRLLVKSQNFRQALSLIRRCFSQTGNMDNIQLLELFAISMYNLQEHYEVTKVVEKIFLLNKSVSSQIYIMACLSYAKLKSYTKALDIIEKGTLQYPQNAQIFYYKGKILFRTKNYQLAQEAFNKSCLICVLPQTLVCLADCYGKVGKKDEQLKILDRLLEMSKEDSTLNYENYLVRKFKTLFQMSKFDQILTEVQLSSQQNISFCDNIQTKAQIEYIQALCHYKKGSNQSAYEKFQDCIVSQSFSLESLKMLTVIEIKEKNFYQASHLCSQVVKKGINAESDDIFNLLMNFVEGSISLVRRNFKQGIQYLAKVELVLDGKEFKRYTQAKEWNHFENIENYEIHKTTRQLVHLFLAYGLFCTGQYRYCQSAINRQKNILNDQQYAKGLEYNFKLCEAILSFQEKHYSESLEYLQQADSIFSDRLQVLFYKAVVLIQVYYRTKEPENPDQINDESQNQMMTDKIMQCFNKALKKVSSTANNTHATILYYKTLFCAYLKDWKQALTSIDEAISKSDDTYWRYYYTKGMIFACIHSFQEAITEITSAINFSQGNRAECFLLRSKCLQIEARGNQAFYDLQQYIALRPQDQDVHMYAGQLLFENGAFEDALTAFEHKDIPEFPENYDIFLTLAKTLFLTGKFNQAHQKMHQAYKLNPQDSEILFDTEIIKFLAKIISSINNNTLIENESTLTNQLFELFKCPKSEQKFGKIFKEMDFYLMQGLIDIYTNDYMKAVENFRKHLSQKRKMIIFEDEAQTSFLHNKSQEDLQKTTHQLKIYTNQMKFNIVVCHLLGGDINTAKQLLKDIKIDQSQAFYGNFNKFRNAIMSQTFSIEKQEILPNKNKLSQFIPPLIIPISSKKTQIKLKLCIPFPKVQPPQIFPVFDKRLLKTLTFFGIEGKPQAPWIVKQDNVIKFTQKISYASRLDFNDSEPSNSTTVIIDLEDSRAEQKNRLKTKSNDRSSMFSKRTLKKKNSINLQGVN